VTPLESIEVYTTSENVRLHEVFQKMQEHEEKIPLADAKSADNATIKGYFKSIFPEFDEDRVYVSDMKKMLKWYELLKKNDLLHFEQVTEEATEAEPAKAEAAAPAEEKAEAAPRKARAKKAETAAEGVAEEKPKKAAKKKAAAEDAGEEGAEKPAKKAAPKKKKAEE
jgi:hypothetical protein